MEKRFIARKKELQTIAQFLDNSESPKILTVYGRRRVGKTELIEFAFKNQKVLKFEGLENLPQEHQFSQAALELGKYFSAIPAKFLKFQHWGDFFEVLYPYVAKGRWVIYLEELQWLSSYDSELISYLKYYWDNHFRHNPEIIIVLCGSSPSFMKNKVIKSRALYNRSLHTIALKEFTVAEAGEFLNQNFSLRNVLDIYLTLGGIPEYLKYVQNSPEIYHSLCKESFNSNGFFVYEYEKIFTSSLSDSANYKEIVQLLSHKKYSSRQEIAKGLNQENAGGSLSKLLFDLEESGIIEKYYPFHLHTNSRTYRYTLKDSFINYYLRFIQPLRVEIESGRYDENTLNALDLNSYYQWLGYQFENFCRRNAHKIADKLGFGGIKYKSGSYFQRGTKNQGYQIDLIFDRSDQVYTICEIKYTRQAAGVEVIDAYEKKLARFIPQKSYSIQRVLISAAGVTDELKKAWAFDRILELEDFL